MSKSAKPKLYCYYFWKLFFAYGKLFASFLVLGLLCTFYFLSFTDWNYRHQTLLSTCQLNSASEDSINSKQKFIKHHPESTFGCNFTQNGFSTYTNQLRKLIKMIEYKEIIKNLLFTQITLTLFKCFASPWRIFSIRIITSPAIAFNRFKRTSCLPDLGNENNWRTGKVVMPMTNGHRSSGFWKISFTGIYKQIIDKKLSLKMWKDIMCQSNMDYLVSVTRSHQQIAMTKVSAYIFAFNMFLKMVSSSNPLSTGISNDH